MKIINPQARTSSIALGTILARYWFLPVVLAIVLAGVGAVIGATRPAEYTASAALSVGTTDVNTTQALGGFAASAPALAGAYSRAIDARQVSDQVGRQVGVPAVVARAQVTASQIPSTPVIRVDAVSGNKDRAIALANASSEALRDYAGNLTRSSESGQDLLRRYRAAQVKVGRLAARQVAIKGNGEDFAQARSDAATAKLEVQSLARAYRQSQVGQGASNPLAILRQAADASSDRTSRAQLYGFTGLIVGLVLGAAFALALGRRRLAT